ncbi:MAG: ATP-binding protein [Geobacteraceae bacterium]|nr:ATP-binding protein [Geobacteraceae bacterium]
MIGTRGKLALDRQSICLLLCLLVAGFAGNFLALRLFSGFNYLFGSIATLMTVRLFGLRWGLVVAVIASSWTIKLFGHPYAMVWLCAEPMFVGYLLRRGTTRNIILYDAIYWPLLGVPLIWFFFQHVMHVPVLGSVAALLMYWVIGITNALAASLLLSFFPRLPGLRSLTASRTVPIHTMIYNLMIAMVAVPAVIIMAIHGRDAYQRSMDDLQDGLKDSSRNAVYETRLLLQRRPTELSAPLYLNSNLAAIREILRAARANPHDTITLLDENNKILCSSDDARPPMSLYDPCPDGILTSSGRGGVNRCLPKPLSPLPLWQREQESTYSLLSAPASDQPWRIVVETPFVYYQRTLFTEHIKTLLVILALNLLTLVASRIVSRRVSTPLRRISQITTDLPERLPGEKVQAWPSSIITEVDQLIDNFRVMTAALNQKFQEITYANETLELRVAERAKELTKTNDELQKEITGHLQTGRERDHLLDELRQKNQELEGIVYVTSHDLRSPLINAQGFSRKLIKSCAEIDRIISSLEPDERVTAQLQPIIRESIPKSLGFITDSIVKMDNLLDGLLRLSRLGQVAICYETLDIQAVMTKIVASMTYQIETAAARVELGELAPCLADAVQFNQVFSNLLDNAIKYRSPDRPLLIRVYSEPFAGAVRYCFEDNGIGIHQDQQDRIWEIFQRINHNGVPGEGLGLTIARRIIDRLGGSISVESTPGSGSRFFVILPAPPASV